MFELWKVRIYLGERAVYFSYPDGKTLVDNYDIVLLSGDCPDYSKS